MRQTGSLVRPIVALMLVLALALASAPARAGDDEPGTAYSGLTGIGAAVCTLVYAPLKIVYAVGGSVIGGLAYLWTIGDTRIAGPIFFSSIRGDYIVLPEHLEGRRKLRFVGKRY